LSQSVDFDRNYSTDVQDTILTIIMYSKYKTVSYLVSWRQRCFRTIFLFIFRHWNRRAFKKFLQHALLP